MSETRIPTNIPVLKRMCYILNSGKLTLPLGAKPGQAHLEDVYMDAGQGLYWTTINMTNWQYLTPAQNNLLNKLDEHVRDIDLFKITKLINDLILSMNMYTYETNKQKQLDLENLIKQANINIKKG